MIRIIEGLEIEIYEDETGRCPFIEWRDSLKDLQAAAKITQRITRLRSGNLGDSKRLMEADGILELRIDFGPGYRIYFGRERQKLIVLLCGGDKKTQDRDIERAIRYWRDYQEQE